MKRSPASSSKTVSRKAIQESKRRLAYLRSIGVAPKLDARKTVNWTRADKSRLTRQFNKFASKYDTYKQYASKTTGKGVLDFVPTKDQKALEIAKSIWGNENVITGKQGLSGFFVPKGLKISAKDIKTTKIKIREVTLSGGKKKTVLSRKAGDKTETFVETGSSPADWTKRGIQEMVEAVEKAIGSNKRGAKVGFVVGNSISRKFYTLAELAARLRYYAQADAEGHKGERSLDIRSIVISQPNKKTKFSAEWAKVQAESKNRIYNLELF